LGAPALIRYAALASAISWFVNQWVGRDFCIQILQIDGILHKTLGRKESHIGFQLFMFKNHLQLAIFQSFHNVLRLHY